MKKANYAGEQGVGNGSLPAARCSTKIRIHALAYTLGKEKYYSQTPHPLVYCDNPFILGYMVFGKSILTNPKFNLVIVIRQHVLLFHNRAISPYLVKKFAKYEPVKLCIILFRYVGPGNNRANTDGRNYKKSNEMAEPIDQNYI